VKIERYYLLFLLFLIFNNTYPQSIANYAVAHQTTISYSSIFSNAYPVNAWRNTNAFSQDDNRSFFINIGFDFWYNGQRYTQISVSTNGFLDFSGSVATGSNTTASFGFENSAFTNSTASLSTRPALAVLYDDLMAQGGSSPLGNSIRTRLMGSAPNRTFTVEWKNMAVYGNTTPDLNFQVSLVETTGQIIYHYGTMAAGTHTFSYSLGINGPTISATPSPTELKMLQVANTNNFSHAIQNNLSTLPLANTRYVFTPPTPANPASNLTITGVSASSLTLSWNDWATNEVGYVIYYSTDGFNYSFVGQTSSNAIGAIISGLTPATNYYWRVHAVTEGWLSASANGTVTTLAAGTKTSLVSGNWSSPATWTPNGVPTAADNVIINNNHTVTIDMNAQCNALQIGNGGTGAFLQIGNNSTARNLSFYSDILVQNGNTLRVRQNSNTTHTLNFFGTSITNQGTLKVEATLFTVNVPP